MSWRTFLLLLLVSSLAHATTEADRNWADAACLIAHNGGACEEALHIAGGPVRIQVLGDKGCKDIKFGPACTALGDALASTNRTAALAAYQSGCDYNHAAACVHVLTLNRTLAENMSKEQLVALSLRLKPIAVKACDLDKKTPQNCVQAETVLAEIGRNQDASFGPCKLKYSWIDKRNYAQVWGEKADGAGLRNLGTREQCVARCGGWLNSMSQPDESLGYLRGICEFSGKDIPPGQWHKNRPRFCAERQAVRVGYEAAPLYARCFCETSPHDEVMDVAEKYGIFSVGVSAYTKNFGRGKWSRCGLRFFYDDAVAMKQDAAHCQENLNAFRRELAAIPTDKTFDYDYGNLKCSNN